jgi:hypothetical protein
MMMTDLCGKASCPACAAGKGKEAISADLIFWLFFYQEKSNRPRAN